MTWYLACSESAEVTWNGGPLVGVPCRCPNHPHYYYALELTDDEVRLFESAELAPRGGRRVWIDSKADASFFISNSSCRPRGLPKMNKNKLRRLDTEQAVGIYESRDPDATPDQLRDVPRARGPKSALRGKDKCFLCDELRRLAGLYHTKDAVHHRIWLRAMADQLIWFWTADGVDRDGFVRRDLLKKDFDFQHYTSDAKAETDPKMIRHEHAVPRKTILDWILKEGQNLDRLEQVLERFAVAVLVTKRDDRRLNEEELRSRMPGDWTMDAIGAPAFARYETAELEVWKGDNRIV